MINGLASSVLISADATADDWKWRRVRAIRQMAKIEHTHSPSFNPMPQCDPCTLYECTKWQSFSWRNAKMRFWGCVPLCLWAHWYVPCACVCTPARGIIQLHNELFDPFSASRRIHSIISIHWGDDDAWQRDFSSIQITLFLYTHRHTLRRKGRREGADKTSKFSFSVFSSSYHFSVVIANTNGRHRSEVCCLPFAVRWVPKQRKKEKIEWKENIKKALRLYRAIRSTAIIIIDDWVSELSERL